MSDDESMPKQRVKPDNKKAKIDTSKWPLLLKVKIINLTVLIILN